MSEQPKALRLADELDTEFTQGRVSNHSGRKAAAELRRLHEENQKLQQQLGEAVWNYGEKVRVNQELLEALKLADALLWGANMNAVVVERKVKAAIAKGEQA